MLLGFVGVLAIKKSNPLYDSVWFEFLSGLGIAVAGISGNILLLLRKPVALPLCTANMGFTILSIGVGVWQILVMALHATDFTRQAAMAGGGIFTLTLRLVLLLLYIHMLSRARKYFAAAGGAAAVQGDSQRV